jgi:hypothetical protein
MKNRQVLFFILIIMGVVCVSGCAGTQGRWTDGSDSQSGTPITSPGVGSGGQQQQPIIFSGTGDQVTPNFPWNGGLMHFDMTHSGKKNFIVWLYSTDGSYQQLLVNQVGSYSGSTVIHAPAGNYLLKITADGSWTIKINH